ncbi:putative molybdenum carrier protein [Fibrella sp. ES10-3-2-2]|nr:hypothetical protein A6C57_06950 [Fibrella sp. ES10-3-2-2]
MPETGIYQLGLEVARSLGIPTGGVAPKGVLTEVGPNSALRDWYGLNEHESAKYPPRTRSNVQQADGTLVLGQVTGGTKLTVDACQKASKPYLVNPAADEVRDWLNEHHIKILNVVGNRGSALSTEQITQYRRLLYDVLMTHQRLAILFQERPTQWGLRGDPFLWDELEQVSRTLVLPKTTQELRNLLLLLISNLIGEELIHGKLVPVARYSFGGMSSGMVYADFWLERAIPLLQERLMKVYNKG